MDRLAKRTIAALLGVDLLLIVLHIVFGWDVINLDQEANLPTWYSSAKLLMLALMSALIWDAERKARQGFRYTWLWLVMALIFLGLSIDETACLHERTGRYIMQESSVGLDIRETALKGDQTKDSFAWVLLLSPFIAGVAVFFLAFFVNRFRRCPPARRSALTALALFVLAIAMESTIYFLPAVKDWTNANVRMYNLFISIEEAGELFGSTLFLLAFMFYTQHVKREVVQ